MESHYWPVIQKIYTAFNERDINSIFSVMDVNVNWPKAFEGGYVTGHEAVKEYWLRQWSEINPKVEPVSVTERPDGKIEVLVHQLVKDLEGNVVFDGPTKHVYSFVNNLIVRMDVE